MQPNTARFIYGSIYILQFVLFAVALMNKKTVDKIDVYVYLASTSYMAFLVMGVESCVQAGGFFMKRGEEEYMLARAFGYFLMLSWFIVFVVWIVFAKASTSLFAISPLLNILATITLPGVLQWARQEFIHDMHDIVEHNLQTGVTLDEDQVHSLFQLLQHRRMLADTSLKTRRGYAKILTRAHNVDQFFQYQRWIHRMEESTEERTTELSEMYREMSAQCRSLDLSAYDRSRFAALARTGATLPGAPSASTSQYSLNPSSTRNYRTMHYSSRPGNAYLAPPKFASICLDAEGQGHCSGRASEGRRSFFRSASGGLRTPSPPPSTDSAPPPYSL